MVPLPGRPRPSASVRQFMELAVNIPAHEPHPGQAQSSISVNCSSVIFSDFTAPTPSKTVIKSMALLASLPASMGPPLTTSAGISSLSKAISIPGTTLSQLGMATMPSKGWARAIISTESAMSSRLQSEYFMPSWFMAMPSQTPMVLNSMGVPPAIRTPAFTASAMRSR